MSSVCVEEQQNVLKLRYLLCLMLKYLCPVVNLMCLSRKVLLWYGQLLPVTSFLPDLHGFSNSVALGARLLVVPASVPPSEGKDLRACGAEAPLPPRVLRDIPNETVKALVDCLVTVIFFGDGDNGCC